MNGYVVMMPDLFYGDPVPLNKTGEFNMQKWRAGEYHPKGTNHLPATVDPVVEACLEHMRTKFNCKAGLKNKDNETLPSTNGPLENRRRGLLFRRQVCRSLPTPGTDRRRIHRAPITYRGG